jgi:hypothetical protein
MSDGFWTGLQTDYDTSCAREKLADVLPRIRRFDDAGKRARLIHQLR